MLGISGRIGEGRGYASPVPLMIDLAPLRVDRRFRRLWVGTTLSSTGGQITTVAIGMQVYMLTGSSFAVGLVGLFALVPLVSLGLYGGALVDAYDRRKVAVLGTLVLWLAAMLTVTQAALGNSSEWVLYGLVALTNAGMAITSPARTSIYPRLLPIDLLPAANALNTAGMTFAMTVGPLAAGFLADLVGYTAAYSVHAVLVLVALWSVIRLPPVPPDVDPETARRRTPGLASVLEGLRFLGSRPNIRMSFLADLVAMILAHPRALLPAIAVLAFEGGEREVGYLSAAIAAGAMAAMLLSGPLGRVNRQGLGVVIAVTGWGAAIGGAGAVVLGAEVLGPQLALWLAIVGLALAGAADSVSSVFRQTILQSATPDHLRGRLQGVFIVVVAGGPRLGDLAAGTLASLSSEGTAMVIGGVGVVLLIAVLARAQSGFLRYDARKPTP